MKIREVPLTALSEMLHFQPIITERRRGTLEHFFTSVVNLFFIFFVIKSRLLVLNRAVCGLGLWPPASRWIMCCVVWLLHTARPNYSLLTRVLQLLHRCTVRPFEIHYKHSVYFSALYSLSKMPTQILLGIFVKQDLELIVSS